MVPGAALALGPTRVSQLHATRLRPPPPLLRRRLRQPLQQLLAVAPERLLKATRKYRPQEQRHLPPPLHARRLPVRHHLPPLHRPQDPKARPRERAEPLLEDGARQERAPKFSAAVPRPVPHPPLEPRPKDREAHRVQFWHPHQLLRQPRRVLRAQLRPVLLPRAGREAARQLQVQEDRLLQTEEQPQPRVAHERHVAQERQDKTLATEVPPLPRWPLGREIQPLVVDVRPLKKRPPEPFALVRVQRPVPQLRRPQLLGAGAAVADAHHGQLVRGLLAAERRVQLHQPRRKPRLGLLHKWHHAHARLPPLVVRPHKPLLQVQPPQQPQPLLLAP